MILYLGALENSQSISAPNKSYVPSSGSGIPLKPSKVKVADPRLYPLICALNLLFGRIHLPFNAGSAAAHCSCMCCGSTPAPQDTSRTPIHSHRCSSSESAPPRAPDIQPTRCSGSGSGSALLQLLQLAEPGCALSAHNQQRSATANSLDISESSALPSRQRVRARNKPLCECQIST